METETVMGSQASKPTKGARKWYTKYKYSLLCIITNQWNTQQLPNWGRYCICPKGASIADKQNIRLGVIEHL